MKQTTLIEMNGSLKSEHIPSDLNVNEVNAEYLVHRFGELESKLEAMLRGCHSVGVAIDNLKAKCAVLTTENAGIRSVAPESRDVEDDSDNMDDVSLAGNLGFNRAIKRMRRQIPVIDKAESRLCESQL